MATPIGANTLTAIARHYIMPTITDNIYNSNVLLYRWMKANKKMVQGGTQIEVPLMFQRFNTGGAYKGYEVLNTTPSDTIKNAAFDWKQHYVTWAIDGLTLLKADSPEAVANIIALQGQQAYMEMAENLANGLFKNPNGSGTQLSSASDIDGLSAAVGNASVGDANYGGLSRSTNTWWTSQIDSSTTSITAMSNYQTMFGNCTYGGQQPTIIVSRQDQYNKYIALNAQASGVGYSVQYNREPGGHDEILANAGFTNALFNNTPWVIDSHVSDAGNTTTGRIYFLNENVLSWVVSPRADFYLEDFMRPVNQDAFVATLLWAGNLVSMSSRLHGAFTALTS